MLTMADAAPAAELRTPEGVETAETAEVTAAEADETTPAEV